jgi:small-conductance mechanosensitive channel
MLGSLWSQEVVNVGGRPITVSQILLALAVFVVGLVLSRIVSRVVGSRLRRRQIDATAAEAIRKLIFWVLLVTVVLTTLHLLNIPVTMFAFLGGAIAIGVGFGTRNLINNFISGWILMAERPVRIGDLVELDAQLGRIQAIGGRSTRIRRTDGVDILVPNSLILERVLVNWTLTDANVRTEVKVGVAYGSDTRLTAELCNKAAVEHPSVLPEPPPLVLFDSFGDNSLGFEVCFWCKVTAFQDLRRVRSDLRFRIEALFKEAGIVIAFPQRDVHLDAAAPIEVRVVGPRTTVGAE